MRIVAFGRYLCILLFLAAICAHITEGDQPTVKVTEMKGKVPAENAHITRYYVDKPSLDSGYETGDLHIIYSDKTEIIETLPPKEKSTEKNIVENQEGIEDVKIAPDQRTIGWAMTFDNCCTSYAIPMVLAIYRSGDTVLHIQQGQTLWHWMFLDGGKQAAASWGPTHGPFGGDYQLYDVKTGHLVSEVFGDPKTQSLSPDAPEWAKETEQQK
jgi:hypothetical protein